MVTMNTSITEAGAQADARLKEAAKLGFEQATLPRRVARGPRPLAPPDGLELVEIGHISDLIARLAGNVTPAG